ncbi:MAG TPA: alkaline phosphatase family protein [Haliangiales bacterium]|nr:alkaline phosphatase family protein [Haliangiales bacterium]
MRAARTFAFLAPALVAACAGAPRGAMRAEPRRVIVIVWDGLRPDSINPTDTPNLHQLRESGTDFTDNHAAYPSFTMMNAAALATGASPGTAGFYGNVLWDPRAKGADSAGKPVDFRQPVFSEDYAVLDDLDEAAHGALLAVPTLFDAAHAAGLATAAVGKGGAIYLGDRLRRGPILDEKAALPLAFARELQGARVALPTTTPGAYPAGALALAPDNANPIDNKPTKRLEDGATADPTDENGSPYKAGLEYLVTVYLEQVLPAKDPKLSVLWLRDPDSTQHAYGVGSANYRDALRGDDRLLGRLRAKLAELGRDATTDVIVVSDHGHSNVAGPASLFPLRAVSGGRVGDIDPNGQSVSGMVRLADLLRRAGFAAFDGLPCSNMPVGLGIKADGTPVYPTATDVDGSVCGKAGQKYQIAPLKVPEKLPPGAIVVAVNGGSDYLYVPDGDPAVVRKAVAFLQSRSEVGAIFVAARHGPVAGTLPLPAIRAENAGGRAPDAIVSYDFDENAAVNGVKGTEYAGVLNNASYRGMHGSFSPIDMHSTLVAAGPDFRRGFKDPLPTGNIDVAPTIARLLGIELPRAEGRPLLEALADGPPAGDYRVAARTIAPDAPATGLTVRLPTDPDGKDLDPGKSSYTFELRTKVLTYGGATFTYFDSAKAIRR